MAITKATASAVAPAAKGDLVVGSATNDAAVLGVGTNGQLLTVDSTTATGLKWIDAPSGGLTQIATGSFSSTQVVISSIPSTYTFLYLRLVDVTNSTGATPLRMRINGNSNNDYRSTEGKPLSPQQVELVLGDVDTQIQIQMPRFFGIPSLFIHYREVIVSYIGAVSKPHIIWDGPLIQASLTQLPALQFLTMIIILSMVEVILSTEEINEIY